VPAVAPPATLERVDFYRRALGLLLPWLLWPFALAGLLLPGRRRYRRELAAFGPLAGTALVIAALVAVDARTQLLIAPLLAWYTARGLCAFAAFLQPRLGRDVRRGFAFALVGGTAVAVLLGIDLYRLWMGATEESTRQVIAEGNREVGVELDRLMPRDGTVMSWSPAVAVWAHRDWRPLPTAPLSRVLRFADATGTRWLVFSTLNPSPLPREQMPRAFLIARILPGAASAERWRIRVLEMGAQHASGELGPDTSVPPPIGPAPSASGRTPAAVSTVLRRPGGRADR